MSKPDKREAFVRLAESRVERLLDTIELLGNLSDKSNYSYSENDIIKIKNAIQDKLEKTYARFDNDGHRPFTQFKL